MPKEILKVDDEPGVVVPIQFFEVFFMALKMLRSHQEK